MKKKLPSKVCPKCKRNFNWRKNGHLIGIKLNTVQKNAHLTKFLNNFWNIIFKIKKPFITILPCK